jgi:hypothetical protein
MARIRKPLCESKTLEMTSAMVTVVAMVLVMEFAVLWKIAIYPIAVDV